MEESNLERKAITAPKILTDSLSIPFLLRSLHSLFSLVPEEVKAKARECCDQISERKTAKKEKKSRGDEPGSPNSKKRKGFDAEARGLIADAKKIDSKDANNKFGRALASLKLEPESVNNEKLKQFIKSISPHYDYPDEAEMKTIWVTLKLTHETFDANANE